MSIDEHADAGPPETPAPDMSELTEFLCHVAEEEGFTDPPIVDEDRDGRDDTDETWVGGHGDRDDGEGGGEG